MRATVDGADVVVVGAGLAEHVADLPYVAASFGAALPPRSGPDGPEFEPILLLAQLKGAIHRQPRCHAPRQRGAAVQGAGGGSASISIRASSPGSSMNR